MNDEDEDETPRDGRGTVTEGGITAPLRGPVKRFAVTPTTKKGEFTAIVPNALFPIRCWRVDDRRFAFDSSFVHPAASNEFALLFAARPPTSPEAGLLSVFGHADATGDVAYNKKLAGRRAMAVYALLTRRTDIWADLYDNAFGGDRWGVRTVQTMLAHLGFDPGPIDDSLGVSTKDALRAFQSARGIAESGANDAPTRLELFQAYMDTLCTGEDGQPSSYQATDFLGRGEDPKLRYDVQGCGEFNPIVVFSKDEARAFEKPENHAARDKANAPNRRVLIYIFEKTAQTATWPCPTTDAGPDGCKKAFWKERGEERRKPTALRRESRKFEETFSCKFYDSFARLSPCEAARGPVQLWIRDQDGKRYEKAVRYELTSFNEVRRGRTDDAGMLFEDELVRDKYVQLAWKPPSDDDDANDSDAPQEQPEQGQEQEQESKQEQEPDAITAGYLGMRVRLRRLRENETPHARDMRLRGWLLNLGFSPDDDTDEALARFAEEWGLGGDASVEEQEQLLAQAQTTGKEAESAGDAGAPPGDAGRPTPSPTASDGTDTKTPANAPDGGEPKKEDNADKAAVKDPCDCKNAPSIVWTPAEPTFVLPIVQFVPESSQRIAGMAADLLFEMPMFDGEFLFRKFTRVVKKNAPATRPKRDPATKLWVRDHSHPELEPQFEDVPIVGVCPETKVRLEWAQQRLWHYYCLETTKKGGTVPERPTEAEKSTDPTKKDEPPSDDASKAMPPKEEQPPKAGKKKGAPKAAPPKKPVDPDIGFKKWLRDQGLPEGNLTIKDKASMHSAGAAIDIGSASPFIAIRGSDGRLSGESHNDVPWVAKDVEKADDRAKLQRAFYLDNAFEPAVAGFERASRLVNNTEAKMTVATGELWLSTPTDPPCKADTKHTKYAERVCRTWDSFHEVDKAWKKYVAPKTFAEFKATLIDSPKLTTAILIDADLLKHAENHDEPPATFTLEKDVFRPTVMTTAESEVQALLPPNMRRVRRRVSVTIGELQDTKQPKFAKAAFLQMRRDKESASMIMVMGNLSGVEPGTKAPSGRLIPCAWPDGAFISVPNTRDVTKGFLGVSRNLVKAMVEAGFTWLGGTGDTSGMPIDSFTGDIMHFDLRNLHNAGSTELDTWLEGNKARQAWADSILEVHDAVGAHPTLRTLKNPNARGGIRAKLAAGAANGDLADPVGLMGNMDDAKAAALSLADNELAALVTDVRASLKKLSDARTVRQKDLAKKVDRAFRLSEEALSKAYFSATVGQALDAVGVARNVTLFVSFNEDYAKTMKDATELVASINGLIVRIKKRAKPSTSSERNSLAMSQNKLTAASQQLLVEAQRVR